MSRYILPTFDEADVVTTGLAWGDPRVVLLDLEENDTWHLTPEQARRVAARILDLAAVLDR